MRRLKKISILGSGVMGSALACHFANAGMEVLMLDMVPKEAADKSPGHASRNVLVNTALKRCIKSKPSPLYRKSFASRIKTGNFDDDFEKIEGYDWILEAVIERLDIKMEIFEKVEQYRSKGSIVTSNTSGIPIHMMAEGRSDDFRAHFCGTHFFNPPRYLRLLELIPGIDTKEEVLDTIRVFGDRLLGKEVVECKDSPAFIANRVGVYAMAAIFEETARQALSITDVDRLTGPVIGRPKSGTFRLSDLVGLDVAVKVIKGIQQNCPEDEMFRKLEIPKAIDFLMKNGYFGSKSGQGFYKKTEERDKRGKRIIQSLDFENLEYGMAPKSRLASLGLARQIDDPKKRILTVYKSEDAGGQLIRNSMCALFAYVSHRVPEISDSIHAIDEAVKAGFGWSFGPFEYWDIIGLERGMEDAIQNGHHSAAWILEMIAAGKTSFYQLDGGNRMCYHPAARDYKKISGKSGIVILNNQRDRARVYQNEEVELHDIGDGILCLEFKSKMNAIGEGILRGLQDSISLAESEGWKGLVIGNQAANFSVGANLMLIGMMAFQKQYMQLEMAVKLFQDTSMRCRYSKIPVVAATQGYTFGGGCEFIMHCDAVAASAESYIGLVEAGIGLLPGGAGTKEFALRASDEFVEGGVHIPTLIERFKTIAMAQVATSAYEAFNHGYLQHRKDKVVHNLSRTIQEAKESALKLSQDYMAPTERQDIDVLGSGGLATLYVAANELLMGGFASEHDIKIARKIASVLCGGDLSGTQKVSERYLLDLEREAFMSLCSEPKTLERIQYMLENNKPLRN